MIRTEKNRVYNNDKLIKQLDNSAEAESYANALSFVYDEDETEMFENSYANFITSINEFKQHIMDK